MRRAPRGAAWVALLMLVWVGNVGAKDKKRKKNTADAPRVAAHAVVLEGALAFVGDTAGLLVLDLSDPLRPRQHARLPLDDAVRQLVLVGNHAYAAIGSHGVSVIDIADPAEPRQLTRYEPPGSVRDLVHHRGHLILAEAHHGLRLLDVKEPADPREMTRMPARNEISALLLRGDRLLTAEREAGVRVIDVTRPAVPREVQRAGELRGARALAEDDGMLAVALGRGGVKLLRFSDGRVGRELATLEERAVGVLLAEGRLYIADGSRGVVCVDVGDPTRPRVLSRVRTQRHPSTGRLAISGDQLFGAGGEGGIFWVDFRVPQAPEVLLPRKRPLKVRMP